MSVSTELALKLASTFNISPQIWHNAQSTVDLYYTYQDISGHLPSVIRKVN